MASLFESLLKEAERLSAKPEKEAETDDEKFALQKRYNAAIDIYNRLCVWNFSNPRTCLWASLTPTQKITALKSCHTNLPIDAVEIITKWRDSFAFLDAKKQAQLLEVLILATKTTGLPAHERICTAVALYNRCYLGECYDCFETIAADKTLDYKTRAEACKFLYGSDADNYVSVAQEYLAEIIETLSIPSEKRYGLIASFISKAGVINDMNMSKIRIPYNEEFICYLQNLFFYEEKNGVRERILSGQHMMTMETLDGSEKIAIGDVILTIALDPLAEVNVKADAADVLMRLGTAEQREKAREVLVQMGYSAVSADSENIMDRVKTVYNYSQNVHDENISESVSKFIEMMIKDSTVKVIPFKDVYSRTIDLIRKRGLSTADKLKAIRSLNRVKIDTATFTEHKVSSAEIFVHVWIRIQKYEGETRALLEERLVEELVEMGDTCSSGHGGRFVNVLSSVGTEGVELRIGYDSQICANLTGRINARIRDIPDDEVREAVTVGMMTIAEKEDNEAYAEFIIPTLEELRTELYKEFVDGNYISALEFEKYFDSAKQPWMDFIKST